MGLEAATGQGHAIIMLGYRGVHNGITVMEPRRGSLRYMVLVLCNFTCAGPGSQRRPEAKACSRHCLNSSGSPALVLRIGIRGRVVSHSRRGARSTPRR